MQTTYVLNNVRIITPFRIVEPGFIMVSKKKIVNLGKVSDFTGQADVPVYDLSGYTVTPGFVDLSDIGILFSARNNRITCFAFQ